MVLLTWTLTWLWCWETTGKGIPCKSYWATAYWCVIDDITLCPCTTRSWTGVTTFFSEASKVTCTFWINDTFRSTVWWTSNITH